MTPIPTITPSALLALAGCLLLAGCGASEAQREARLPPESNLLLITVDTLRADHLSSWGYPRPTSPAIDRLAAEGVRFAQASVQWPKTGPSFASIFTSTYGKDNGIVRKVGVPLPCRFETIAEVLREHGYGTHAVVSNGAVGSEFDFDQGFDTYLETWKLAVADGSDPTGAERVNRLATGLLDRLDHDRPWFLWVHYLDPHWPYRPPREHWDRFQDDEHFDPAVLVPVAAGKDRQEMGGMGERQVELGRTELAFYHARYDAEIAYVDGKIGELLAEMRRRGLLERTLTAFTADHGESLGDHDYYFEHGRFGFQSCLHVPLVLHYPGVLAPRVDPRPVALIDLAPTLLEAAGVELAGGVWRQGRSLLPRLFGEPGTPETPINDGLVFSEAGYETRGKWQKIVRDGRFKLVYAQTRPEQRWIGGAGVRFTLYDLERDPGETVNVAGEHPAVVERLTRALWAWDRAPRFDVEVEPASAECEERPMEKETEELLRSLGYL